ncbi:MAG: SPOR domain-containing protein [Myxococcota bacterium]
MQSERRRAGWLSTLVALVLLVVAGFLFGAMAGFLWEEPRLVFAYLSGESESVDWSDPTPTEASLPEVAAPPPPKTASAPKASTPKVQTVSTAKVETAKVQKPKRESAPKPAPPVSARPPRGFAVQVGSFEESAAADRLAVSLRDRGYTTYVKTDPASAGRRWRVRVGPVPAREEAVRLASKLEKREKLPTWVLEETGE